ncbi:TIGR01777 family oxidoreductase [Paenibacillus yanchengensis]|uniref:TIGR01777 family oxidoreductase n=1 Tax=Paenibacillus yanchengensis TaxID=2035833 RepID=A0ABW4YFN7_9BACL
MQVLIAGGSGFVGQALAKALLQRDDEVIIVSRHSKPASNLVYSQYYTWDDITTTPSLIENVHAIVNLSGATINQRWTKKAKQNIVSSRLWSASKLADLLSFCKHNPVVVNASGISVYGNDWDTIFHENSPVTTSDFLSQVVHAWEQAADQINASRLIKLRIGVVLARKGGAFPLMCLPYRLLVGGKIGPGKQPISWIHLDDLAQLIIYCIDHNEIKGVVNGSAPHPITNNEFGKAIGRALGKPHYFPLPGWALQLVLGEMSQLLLTGQHAIPEKALNCGFKFQYPTADVAMKQIFTNSNHS